MSHPLTDALPSYMDANALRQACGEIEERLTRERDEARALNAESFCCGGGDACAGGAGCQCHALRAEVERLTSAIRWALGYDEGPPAFEPPEDADTQRYWWRNELRRRAALQEPTP